MTTHPGSPIRVLVVDDHEVLATSLAHALDAEPDLAAVGVSGTVEGAAALIRTTAPDVLLLDHRLPDGDGVDAVPMLRSLRPSMAVVVLTASTAEHLLLSAVEAGVAGFLSKTRGFADVAAAVRAAAVGEAVISPEMLARLLPRLNRDTRRGGHEPLTRREREVLELLAQGLTNAAIATRLGVSVHTVRNHVANLSAKLGARSKLEALSIAVREGLLPGG
ncbi:response regulator transcription factor [Nocardioides coralli]|uniref:response regulator transcription factor n=1 Tax=Nocardioides coralli TaxID=2872154 RepID=UPI001CA387A5|nr:response regulator transcription factor [Nocardioides coralli]QZY30304.1 response regulator transcription factor [Nocardioides coralli]